MGSELESRSRPLGRRPHHLLRTGPALGLLVLLSFLLNGYYLGGDFQADEYYFLNMMREEPSSYSRMLGFWAVDEIPAIQNVWWFAGGDTGVFWRPLPSLVIEGSVRLFGETAFPLHLLSVLLHGLVGGAIFLLARRLAGSALLGLLAGVLFLTCEDHSMVVGWISTGTDIACLLFATLALLCHAIWLERRRFGALVASLAALVAAFLCKESAVIVPVAIVAMTLLLPGGRDAPLPAGRGLQRRVRMAASDWLSWAPAVLLMVAYLMVYRALGFGGISSGMYIDPFTAPLRYLIHLLGHVPVMWLATLSPVLPSLVWFLPETLPLVAAAGAVAFALFLASLWFLRRSGLVIWALCLFLVALLPQMSTDASERCLYFPAVGASILLALLLARIRPIARRVGSPAAPRLARAAGWCVLVCVLLPGTILSGAMPFMYRPSFERPNRDAATIAPLVEAAGPDHVLLLDTPGFFHTLYMPPIVEYLAGRPLDVRVLSSMNGVMSVERAGDHTVLLIADRPGWLTSTFAALLRPPRPPRRGEVFSKGLLTATIVELTPGGSDARVVRFEFDRPLNDPSLLFVHWDGHEFQRFDVSALADGEPVALTDTSDVWSSMW